MRKINKELPKNYLTEGINFLLFLDKHYQFKKPSLRKDDFSETEEEKVKRIISIGKEHNVRAFLQAGDFLDKPKLPNEFIEEILKEWNFSAYKEARELYESGEISKEELSERLLNYIPIVGTVGNHELYGGSLSTLNKTSLGFLSEIGFVNLVYKDKPFLFKTSKGNKTVAITGLPYDLNLLKDKNNFIQDKKYGDIDIFLVHEALYNTSLGNDIGWMPIDNIYQETKSEITIAGHIHHGFGWIEKDDKIFGNPGAIAQQTSAVTELDREIVVSLIHISESGDIFIKDIPLETPTSRELFDLSVKDNKKTLEESINSVKDIISSMEDVSSTNSINIISSIANQNAIPKEVTDIAIEKTISIKSQINTVSKLDPTIDYRIRKLTLHNFEAHAHSEIVFEDDNKPYLLIGESSNGKSSFPRALYWCLENEGNINSIVRKNTLEAYVEIERWDGLKAKRIVSFKKNRKTPVKNGWEITFPNNEVTETNTQGLPYIQELFGFNYLYLDSKEKIGINFRKQKDQDFFIGLKSTDKAKVLGGLFGTQYIIEAIKSLESDRRSLTTQSNQKTKEIEQLNEDIKELSYLEEEGESLKLIKSDINTLRGKEGDFYKLKDIVYQLNTTNKNYNNIKKVIRQSGNINQLILTLSDLKEKDSNYKILLKEVSKYHDINLTILDINRSLKHKDQINQLSTDILLLKKENEVSSSIQEYYSEYKSILNKLLVTNKLISLYKENDSIGRLSELKEKNDLFEESKALFLQIRSINKNIVLIDSTIKEKTIELEKLRKELEQLSDKTTEIDFGFGFVIKDVVIKGDTNLDAKLIKELEDKINTLNNNVIRSEGQKEELEKNKAELEGKLSKLGVDPEDAIDILKKKNEEIEDLYQSIQNNLNKIENDIK